MRAATAPEVQALREENSRLKQVLGCASRSFETPSRAGAQSRGVSELRVWKNNLMRREQSLPKSLDHRATASGRR